MDQAPQLSPVAISTKAAFDRGFQDLNFFARMCVPNVMTYDFPPHYIAIWVLLVRAHRQEDRARMLRFALGLPRGFAKTTFLKVLITWFLCYDFITFVLVVCATEPLAQNFIADIDDMLSTPTMEAVYGTWSSNKAIDNRDNKKASYRRRVVTLWAVGANSSVRGLNVAHERPDFIACDDMQTKDNADSDTDSLKLLEHFVGTILKLVNPAGAMAVYCGNMYAQNCILEKLHANPHWTSLVTGCILADGTSLWENVHSLKSLYESFQHDEALGLGHIWFAEMMNQPLRDLISLLPHGVIPKCQYAVEDLNLTHGYIIIDPAGFREASDDNVVLGVGLQSGIPYVTDIAADRFSPGEVIKETIKIAFRRGYRLVFIESVGYQQTLKYWFEVVTTQMNIRDHFVFIEISRHNKKKEPAIRTSVQLLLEKKWFIADQTTRQRYVFQALNYKIGKPKQKDDILDAGAYIDTVQAEFGNEVMAVPINRVQEQQGYLIAATPF